MFIALALRHTTCPRSPFEQDLKSPPTCGQRLNRLFRKSKPPLGACQMTSFELKTAIHQETGDCRASSASQYRSCSATAPLM